MIGPNLSKATSLVRFSTTRILKALAYSFSLLDWSSRTFVSLICSGINILNSRLHINTCIIKDYILLYLFNKSLFMLISLMGIYQFFKIKLFQFSHGKFIMLQVIQYTQSQLVNWTIKSFFWLKCDSTLCTPLIDLSSWIHSFGCYTCEFIYTLKLTILMLRFFFIGLLKTMLMLNWRSWPFVWHCLVR